MHSLTAAMHQPNRLFSAFVALTTLACLYVPAGARDKPAESPAGAEADFITNVRQLTFEGRRAGEGYFSADGSKMVFQSERDADNPFYQIYLMDLETGDVERVSPGHGKTTCAWIHPSGKKVLFSSTHEDPESLALQEAEFERRAAGTAGRYAWDYDEHYEVYECDLATRKYRVLSPALGYDAEGSWSPNGKYIAFASNRHAYSEKLSAEDAEKFEIDKSFMMDIYIMDADGGNLRRLTDVRGYDGGPFFSADGKKICWRRFSEDGARAEIFTVNIDGSAQKQLTRLGAMSWAPFFHPSGEYLIFTTNRHGFANFELYLVDAAGEREPVRVTCTDGWDGLPVFSPNGKQLAWSSKRSANKQAQIFLADWNHAAARRKLGLGTASTQADKLLSTTPATTPPVQTTAAITADDLRRHVEFLASERCEGRLTGSPGERLAARYVADCFKQYGLEPAGSDGTYFQDFEFTFGVSLGSDNSLTLESPEGPTSFAADEDWRPLAFSGTGEFAHAGVVFAGYGISAPAAGDDEAYDSFVHLDVTDKWAIVFRFMPENVPAERRQYLARYSTLRYKAMLLRDKGARGMLVVSGPNSQVKSQLMKLAFDAALGGGSLPAISITDSVADKLLANAGKSLKGLQDELDSGEPAMGFEIDGITLAANIDLKSEKRVGRNVLARLSAGSTRAERPAVLVGAHLDHLGRGESSSSLARDNEEDAIHYGADDNASGVAAVLEIAEYLADARRAGKLALERDIVFATWSGEELGLLGSAHYCDDLDKLTPDDGNIASKVAACVNIDMIGRLRDKLMLSGVSSSSTWPREVERRAVPAGIAVIPVEDAYAPSDSTSFYLKRVPSVSAFTGAHGDYHTPRDTADKLNYDGARRVTRFLALVTRSLALSDAAPDYVKVARTRPTGVRAGMRAYLGTVPDYAGTSGKDGVKLTDVTAGAPAAEAGVHAGDVVVELAGTKIENLYDYSYAIGALKIGEPVRIVVMRDGKRVELTVTPGSRE